MPRRAEKYHKRQRSSRVPGNVMVLTRKILGLGPWRHPWLKTSRFWTEEKVANKSSKSHRMKTKWSFVSLPVLCLPEGTQIVIQNP